MIQHINITFSLYMFLLCLVIKLVTKLRGMVPSVGCDGYGGRRQGSFSF